MTHQTHDSTPLFLNKDEQANLGKYIRDCEVDQLQAKHYEEQYLECAKYLSNKPSLSSTVMGYLLVLSMGYVIGVNH